MEIDFKDSNDTLYVSWVVLDNTMYVDTSCSYVVLFLQRSIGRNTVEIDLVAVLRQTAML